MATELEIAWAAGLFEGEGSACISSGQRQPIAALVSTDQDVVERFAAIMGIGNIRTYRRPPNKRYWQWSATSRDDVLASLGVLFPFLGERRRERANEVLEHAAALSSRAGEKTHCKRGHDFSHPGVLYIHAKTGKRHCRVCRNAASARSHALRRRVPRLSA